MRCGRCGKNTSDEYMFCEHCGAKLNSDLTPDELELMELDKRNQAILRELQNMEPPQKRPLKIRIAIWLAMCVGFTALCGIGSLLSTTILQNFK